MAVQHLVGNVPEYGSKASGKAELAAIGLNVRMIDVNDGSIVWSVSDTAISDRPTSLSAFANRMVRNLVGQLLQEMIRVGDTRMTNVPTPAVASSRGKIRGAVIEIQTPSLETIKSYKILRSRSEAGPYREVADLEVTDSSRMQFEDRNLLDAETYYYGIYAVTKSNLASYPTEPLKISTTGPPGTITGLAARSGLVRRVVLTWSPTSDNNAEGYSILRRSGGGRWIKIKKPERQVSRNLYRRESSRRGNVRLPDRELQRSGYRIPAIGIRCRNHTIPPFTVQNAGY